MASLNQLRVERKKYYRNLKKLSRKVDSAQEALERQINRVISRKLNVPDTKDFQTTVELFKLTVTALNDMNNMLARGFIE